MSVKRPFRDYNNIATTMKRFLFLIMAMFFAVSISAQDYDSIARFVKKYDGSSKKSDFVNAVMPEYNFTKDLNSKSLHGKFVVLSYWASWCVPCRKLLHDIDSLLVENYKDVQFIGVDADEKSMEKAHKIWDDGHFKFSMVEGASADECCKSVKGAHPTLVIVDNKGIIRARWDAYGFDVANFIGTTIWALKTIPEKKIPMSVEIAEKLMGQKDFFKALYVLEMLPESDKTCLMKLECLYAFKEMPTTPHYHAKQYVQELSKKYADNAKMMAEIDKINTKFSR
jgi:thiol-disulfide isomerase/thioredoxin